VVNCHGPRYTSNVEFETALIHGHLLGRRQRFFADVVLATGEPVVAHCANPGSMRTCAPAGAAVWLSEANGPKRKLKYTWELVEANGQLVCVNTARANAVVTEALEGGVVRELGGFDELRREVRFGDRSRIDFLLSRGGEHTYVEVKSVTLDAGDGVSAFPDSLTARGTRHLHELVAAVETGHGAALLFCAQRGGTRAVRPADEIDPAYGQALRRARESGVAILAYACEVSLDGVWLRERVPVELPAL
jgi:sugar fermentation stimulation protein A